MTSKTPYIVNLGGIFHAATPGEAVALLIAELSRGGLDAQTYRVHDLVTGARYLSDPDGYYLDEVFDSPGDEDDDDEPDEVEDLDEDDDEDDEDDGLDDPVEVLEMLAAMQRGEPVQDEPAQGDAPTDTTTEEDEMADLKGPNPATGAGRPARPRPSDEGMCPRCSIQPAGEHGGLCEDCLQDVGGIAAQELSNDG